MISLPEMIAMVNKDIHLVKMSWNILPVNILTPYSFGPLHTVHASCDPDFSCVFRSAMDQWTTQEQDNKSARFCYWFTKDRQLNRTTRNVSPRSSCLTIWHNSSVSDALYVHLSPHQGHCTSPWTPTLSIPWNVHGGLRENFPEKNTLSFGRCSNWE